MTLIDKYIGYLTHVRRFSPRTVAIYHDALKNYLRIIHKASEVDDRLLLESLNRSEIRQYVVAVMEEGLSARTVGLHLSGLSSFCRYLMKYGHLKSNPVRLVTKPKVEKRLPVYFRKSALEGYFAKTAHILDEKEYLVFKDGWDTESGKNAYNDRLSRLIISLLYNLGLRRAELLGLTVGSVDFGRNIVKVTGKGDKKRSYRNITFFTQIHISDKKVFVRDKFKNLVASVIALFVKYFTAYTFTIRIFNL